MATVEQSVHHLSESIAGFLYQIPNDIGLRGNII